MKAYSRIGGSGIARREILYSNDKQRLPSCFFEFCVSIMWAGPSDGFLQDFMICLCVSMSQSVSYNPIHLFRAA